MDDQYELFKDDSKSIEERFQEFHAGSPWVYRELVKLARGLIGRGRKKIGIGMLYEVLRWSYYMRTEDENPKFKLNDNYRSRYARLIMKQEKDLEGCFEVRGLRS